MPDVDLDRERGPVPTPVDAFEATAVPDLHPVPERARLVGIDRPVQLPDLHSGQRFRVVAGFLAQTQVRIDNIAVGVVHIDHVRRVVEERFEAGGRPLESLPSSLFFGDILHDHDQLLDLPVVRDRRHGAPPDDLLAGDLELGRVLYRLPFPHTLSVPVNHLRSVPGTERFPEGLVPYFPRRQPGELLHSAIEPTVPERSVVVIHQDEPGRHLSHDGAQFGVGLFEFGLEGSAV